MVKYSFLEVDAGWFFGRNFGSVSFEITAAQTLMNKKELKKWIEKNEMVIKNNVFLIGECQKEIEFSKKIIEEIKKIIPDDELPE